MSIGDKFPLAARLAFAERNLIVGAVLRAYVTVTEPPKIKRFVIIGIDDESKLAAVVLINTNKPALPTLAPYQYETVAEEREYLDHDCFVDCSRIYPFDFEELRNLILRSPEIILGHVNTFDRNEIRKLAGKSRLIAPADKIKFHLVP